jgi:hypothetical protein
MRKVATTLVAVAMCTVFGGQAFITVASAGECTADSSGYNQQNANCSFSCGERHWIHVEASVDDNGDVDALGECADESAGCSDTDGYCHDSSEATTSYSDQTGQCKGGDGGWYTNFEIHCWSQYGGTASSSSFTFTDASPSALLLPNSGTHAYIIGSGDGTVQGYVCTDAGCNPVQVACEVGPDEWTCEL